MSKIKGHKIKKFTSDIYEVNFTTELIELMDTNNDWKGWGYAFRCIATRFGKDEEMIIVVDESTKGWFTMSVTPTYDYDRWCSYKDNSGPITQSRKSALYKVLRDGVKRNVARIYLSDELVDKLCV